MNKNNGQINPISDFKMELLKTLICCTLICIVITDIIVARPMKSQDTELMNLVKDIDKRLIKSEHEHKRRRKRQILSQNMALLEYCLRLRRRRCHALLSRMRSENPNPQFTVVVIEK